MGKMVSPNGVKANMCCASCKYYTTKVVPIGPGARGIKVEKWCGKKNTKILHFGRICGYYVMAEFFQRREYKRLDD